MSAPKVILVNIFNGQMKLSKIKVLFSQQILTTQMHQAGILQIELQLVVIMLPIQVGVPEIWICQKRENKLIVIAINLPVV